MRTRRRARRPAPPPVWGPRKLLAALAAAGLAVVGLLTGLALAGYYTVTAGSDRAGSGPVSGAGLDPREELASRPMPRVAESASRPGPLATRRAGVLDVPPADRLGPAGVSTGYPRSAPGALAQLAAIDQAALQSASVPGAQRVIEAWALAGGPTAETWSAVRATAGLLEAAGLPGGGSASFTVSASPEMGLIKGTVGRGYVVACVDFVVTATLTRTARVAAADCQRMVWAGHRWMIGPGAEPAQPPSVWPGTEDAFRVGYRELRDG